MDEILDVDAVAKILDIHPNTVRKYAKSGTIPGFLIARQWRFHKGKFMKWVEEQGC